MRLLTTALLAATVLAAGATSASADSIVYVKRHNLWLMAPDGSKQRQVTKDGTAREPYMSPSQDDRGRIAAGKGYAIVVLSRTGSRIARFVPQKLKDTIGQSTIGQPTELAFSPDGKRIAYAVTSVGCDVTTDCGVRAAVGIVAATGKGTVTRPGEFGGTNPFWISSSRLLWNGGYGSQNRVFDLGATESWNWFDDHDIHTEPLTSTDLSDPAVSGDGRYYAAVRGYGDTRHIIWHRITGPVAAGNVPTELCETNLDPQAADPSLSPDGTGLAMADVDGIQVKRNLDDCDDIRLVAAGGSEPDWGPAS